MIFIPKNVSSSKNGKRWTGKYLINSKTTMEYIKHTKRHYAENKDKFLEMTEDLEPPYYVSFKFIRDTRRRFDYVNPLQTVQDMMVKYEWIEDDNMKFIIPVLIPYELDKENAGVYIDVINKEKYEQLCADSFNSLK